MLREEEIIKSLKEQGYTNKLIDYQEFLELYKPYKDEMTEKDFAEILGISYSNHKSIKHTERRAKILKENINLSEQRKEEIIKSLKKQGYTSKLIHYQEFLELYKPYKDEMTEIKFAEILGISYSNYMNIKHKGKRAKILKEKINLPEEGREEIRESLKKQGYTNKLIDYQEFLELYKPYKDEMTEIKFAKILGISYDNHYSMKNRGTRAKMLKEDINLSEEGKEEIRENLKKQGYTNKLIDYQEFLELYRSYKNQMPEIKFAEVLGISYGNHNVMKNNGQRAKILKEETNLSAEGKEEIIKSLKEQSYTNKLIYYEEFLELYKPYKDEMTEIKFAEILGISYSNHYSMKNTGTRAKINFNYKKLTMIRYQLSLDSREYKKEELEQLCKKYGVTLEELLLDLFPNIVVEKLMNKEKIYIGKCRIPESFLKKHSKKLLHISQQLSKMISKKYNFKSDIEDIASDVLINLIERKGDILRYSETDNEALEHMKLYMSKAIKYKYITKCKVRGTLSLDESISDDKKRIRYDVVKAPQKTEIDENEIQKTLDEKSIGSIVKDMKKCYEKGMENSDAIAYVRKKYEISRKELLKILEEELSKKRRIVRTSTGEVYLGEEYDNR